MLNMLNIKIFKDYLPKGERQQQKCYLFQNLNSNKMLAIIANILHRLIIHLG